VPITHLLYLHGFRSSPQSTKARLTGTWVARHRPDLVWCCPQLPASPRAAMQLVLDRVAGWPVHTMAAIGSSLGGFYAELVARRAGCKAVLLNPAVDPARDLAGHVGENRAWHSDEQFDFRAEYIDELRELQKAAGVPSPHDCYAVIAKGDELLDWREMTAACAHCTIKLLEGSDHALSDYERHLPDVLRFLGIT
jgi:predicted esterase YcpF (UPF0227 family)